MPRDLSQKPSAVRMRRLRERQREGIKFYRVALFGDFRDGLAELGLLSETDAADTDKLSAAIGDFCDAALVDALCQKRDAHMPPEKPVLHERSKEKPDV